LKNIQHSSSIYTTTGQGKEIYRTEDEFGVVVVTQRGDKRVLSFGSAMEQSAVYIKKPYYLVYNYTQVMLLGLIFVDAKHVTLLGLGGGSLAICLRHFFAELNIQVVELRQAVIDVAYEWFLLPRDASLNVVQSDAYLYLSDSSPESTDLIFSDLFEKNEAAELQSQEHFIKSCHNVLTAHGCLVLNLHTEPEAELSLMRILHSLFENISVCSVINGNWVLFCQKNPTQIGNDVLKSRAQLLVEQVNMPLMYYYRNLSSIA